MLESFLLHPSPWLFFGVGLIEEAVKLSALVVLTRHVRTRTLRDGMILGAAVGFGFAAFESAGYAFTALFSVDGLSLVQLVQTEGEQFVATPHGWLVEPSTEQVNIFTAMEWGGLALVSIIGIAWLLVLWRRTPRPVRVTWGLARGRLAPADEMTQPPSVDLAMQQRP